MRRAGLLLLAALAAGPVLGDAAPPAAAARERAIDDAAGPLFRAGGPDPAAVERWLDAVAAAPGRLRIVRLETTLDWGCPCPTWVFPFHDRMQRLRHVMVLPAPGLAPDPTGLALPGLRVRMQGRFTGETLSGLEWVARRGAPPPGYPARPDDEGARREYWSDPGLLFVVERWCFEEPARAADRRWLLQRGARRCAGATGL